MSRICGCSGRVRGFEQARFTRGRRAGSLAVCTRIDYLSRGLATEDLPSIWVIIRQDSKSSQSVRRTTRSPKYLDRPLDINMEVAHTTRIERMVGHECPHARDINAPALDNYTLPEAGDRGIYGSQWHPREDFVRAILVSHPRTLGWLVLCKTTWGQVHRASSCISRCRRGRGGVARRRTAVMNLQACSDSRKIGTGVLYRLGTEFETVPGHVFPCWRTRRQGE